MPPRPAFPHLLLRLALGLGLALPAAAPLWAQEDAGAYLAGQVASSHSNFPEAARWFERVLQSDPTNLTALEGRVVSLVATGDFAAAEAPAKALLDIGQNSPSALIVLLDRQVQAGRYAEIVDDLGKGLTISAILDGLVKGWAQLGDGKMTEALATFDATAQNKGLEAFGLYHKALALASAGDFEGADKILSGEVAGSVASFRRGVIAHAEILSQLERNADAVALLDRSFGPDPDPGIRALRARLVAGEPVPFDIARTAREGIAEAFFSLATALSGQADDTYTLLYTRTAVDLRPDHVEALLMTAGLLASQGQYGLATETYALIPPEDPSYHVAVVGGADALNAKGRGDDAVEVLRAILPTHGTILQVQMALGDMLRRQEKFAEALPVYDDAIALVAEPEPRHWSMFFARGICHERLSQWPEAEADFRTALRLAPDQPQVLNYLGYSFVDRRENLEEALEMIQRAVAAEPESGYIVDSLAWAYFRLGRFAEAVEPMERASLLEPVDPIVTDHLGDVYWAVGRQREAEFQWRRALSFGPEEKEAERIRQKLERGLDAVRAEEGDPPFPPPPVATPTGGATDGDTGEDGTAPANGD